MANREWQSAHSKRWVVDYLGTGDNLRVKLSELSKRIFTPVSEDETAEAIWEALCLPQINAEVLEKYPNWQLPSRETFANVLERDFRMQHGAAQSYIADLYEKVRVRPLFQAKRGSYAFRGRGGHSPCCRKQPRI